VALYLAILGALWRQHEEVAPRAVPLPVAKAGLVAAIVAIPVLLHIHYRLLAAEWYHNRVTVAEGMGLWSEVIASGREGMRLNPWHVKIVSTLARGYVESGQVATGVALMEKALRWSPNDINRIANYGAALVRMGRTADAKAAFERALALTPDYARALSGLGTVHLDAGEYELALGRFQQAAIYEPANPQYHFNVGVALLKLQRKPEALAAFRAAVERKPDWALAQKNVGVLLLPSDPVQAILHLRRAVELEPRIEGHEEIRKMCQQAGRPLPPLR
jgi:tetratricopeptide (TPR) repeat protein